MLIRGLEIRPGGQHALAETMLNHGLEASCAAAAGHSSVRSASGRRPNVACLFATVVVLTIMLDLWASSPARPQMPRPVPPTAGTPSDWPKIAPLKEYSPRDFTPHPFATPPASSAAPVPP